MAPGMKTADRAHQTQRVLTKNMAIGSATISLAADRFTRGAIITNYKFKSRQLDESSQRAMRFLNAKNLHFSIDTFDFRHERPLSKR
jgi:hypothetical protein